jgi:SAM-dependent methyltransferase
MLTDVVDPFSGKTFHLAACPACGLIQTFPVPPDIGAFYGTAYYGNRHGVTARFRAARRTSLIAPLAPTIGPRRLLDIGCGEGSFLLAARRRGWTVYGTELNPAPASEAGLTVWNCLDAIPADLSFDCITLWHTLEHMPDVTDVLRQAHALLAPHGSLVIAVPNVGGFQAQLFKRHWAHLDVPRHLYHFTRVALDRQLLDAGFQPCRYAHQELEYDLFGWSQSLLNVLFKTPNVFYLLLTGKSPTVRPAPRILHAVLGTLFSALALPLVWISAVLRRGGTLIVFARKGR